MEEAHHYRITNVLLLFMTTASLALTIACFLAGAWQAGLLNSTAPLVFFGGLLAMRAGYTRLARVLVLAIAYFGGYCLATIVGPEGEIQLIILLAGALTITFFPLEQWKYTLYGLSLPIISFVMLEVTGYQPILGLERAALSDDQLLKIRLASVLVVWAQVLGQVAYYIRARRASQARLISSAKMVAVGHMASGIAHEINNPLFLIMGNAERLEEIAQKGDVPKDEAIDISKRIQKVSARIGAIVGGLRTISRDSSNDDFVDIPVHQLVRLTLDFCQARLSNLQVDLRLSPIPELLTARGREAQISEVLLNVIDNAIDATADLPVKWIRIEARAREGMVEISVEDSGPGVDPKLRSRIFDPFFTTKPVGKGTGLGLSVSRAIMRAHRGFVVLDEKSRATRFVIGIPAVAG